MLLAVLLNDVVRLPWETIEGRNSVPRDMLAQGPLGQDRNYRSFYCMKNEGIISFPVKYVVIV